MSTAAHSAHVIALGELHDIAHPEAPFLAPDSPHPLHRLKARLEVCVGHVSVSVGDLMAARQGQVYTLDRRIDEPVDLLIEGEVVARGELVAVGDQFAVRITELPLPLKA